MTFLAPSPASSSSDSHPYSPHISPYDHLGFDPSDPLNLIVHDTSPTSSLHTGNSSMDELLQDNDSPPEWSQLTALWPDTDAVIQGKPYSEMMDFSDITSLHMDIDFNPSISVEPSALHYNPMIITNYPYDAPIPSSSSSVPDPAVKTTYEPGVASTLASDTKPLFSNDPAVEIAERVRQSAGVMLALPMNAQLQALGKGHQEALPVSNNSSKLPIPRLMRHTSQSKAASTTSSTASTPPPSTPSPPPVTPGIPPAPLSRPKTSHTTIERRYRTNLNARIQSLRMAVPALRVVEDRDGKKRAPNKVLVANYPTRLEGENIIGVGGVIDVVDERGFVDGVKVARKCSKANVLGKAVEYIRVLKKREFRLKAEQSGLKALISGLVGGPALLREWEWEWKERFGGEEKDEVEGELEDPADEDDSDDELDDMEEEGGRKRKRGKLLSPETAVAKPEKERKEKKAASEVSGSIITEKRKRGRPRKIHPIVPTLPDTKMQISQGQMPSGPNEPGHAPQQYLFATFALFSFFNSPLTSMSPSTSHAHMHTGTVLSAPAVAELQSWGLTDYLHVFHLLVSIIVLLSFASRWVGLGGFDNARSLLGWLRALRRTKRIPQADWMKLGEDCILAGSKFQTPPLTRIQIYYNITSLNGASTQGLSIAAMALYGVRGILGPLARAKARALWAMADTQAHGQRSGATSVYERMVLDNMTVDQAIERLSSTIVSHEKGQSVMQMLGCVLVKERVRRHLALLFIGSVLRGEEDRGVTDKQSVELNDAIELQQTIDAAKELGGHVAELGKGLERVWKVVTDHRVHFEEEENGGIDGEIGALLTALVLYRRMTSSSGSGASSLLSPPPSPGRKDISDACFLRTALGNRVFEEWAELEDARDRAVDMVVALERKSVGLD